ncbi:MAG: hypothetical protein ABI910_10380 [Gemmatimonadota bacterium]
MFPEDGTAVARALDSLGVSRRTSSILCAAFCALSACGGDASRVIQPRGAPPPATATGFTLTSDQPSVALLQGSDAEGAISVQRDGGSSQAVTLTVEGAPDGVTAEVVPTVTTGTRVGLEIRATQEAAEGAFDLTIRGYGVDGSTRSTTVKVAIIHYTGGAGNVVIDFTQCPVGERPVWFASQDGDGAWTQVIGAGDRFRFNVAAARGGVAWVTGSPAGGVSVTLRTREEFASPPEPCGVPGRIAKRVSGYIANFRPGEAVNVGYGGGWNAADPDQGPVTTPSFLLTHVRPGMHDLVAYRYSPRGDTDERVLIRRDVEIADGETLGTLDFDGPESFAPERATLTITGPGAASATHGVWYTTGDDGADGGLYDDPTSGAQHVMRGIPAIHQRPTDLHWVWVSTPNVDRSVSESFHLMADMIVALPAALPAPEISAPTGSHKRISARLSLPPEYQRAVWLFYRDAARGGWGADIHATFGWLGSPTATLVLPDFSEASGWRSSYLPAASASVSWWLYAEGTTSNGGPRPAEGIRSVSAWVRGNGPA